MSREKSEHLPEPRKPIEILRYVGEPERKCSNCQHWRRSKSGKGMGDCHNLISQFMQTRESSCCARGFYPDVARFPLEKRIHASGAAA